jgi:DNA-binding transcriptional ArsR family regulator
MAARKETDARPEASLRAIAGLISDPQDRTEQRLLNDRVRLGILSCLAVTEKLSFRELQSLLDATDGNLSVHARKLEEAGFVDQSKRFDGRQPKTEYRLTATGRKALERHLAHMEALIKATKA